jgi:hypothetical protein
MSRAGLEKWRTGAGGEPLMAAFIESMMGRVTG